MICRSCETVRSRAEQLCDRCVLGQVLVRQRLLGAQKPEDTDRSKQQKNEDNRDNDGAVRAPLPRR